jgi:Rieske Fe-S protein
VKSKFSKERRDMLNSTCVLVGATAVVSVGGSSNAFAETEAKAAPVVQAKNPAGAVRDSDNSTILFWRVAPGRIPADIKDSTVDGFMAYSAVCTHLDCMLTVWVKDTHVFECPCHDAMFDPLQGGKLTGGATCRTLPILPLMVADGKLVVADKFIGYPGVKRG